MTVMQWSKEEVADLRRKCEEIRETFAALFAQCRLSATTLLALRISLRVNLRARSKSKNIVVFLLQAIAGNMTWSSIICDTKKNLNCDRADA